MKKALSCILILSMILGLCSLLFGCGSYFPDVQTFKEIQHYKDKNNFVTITATCINAQCYSKPSKTHYYAIDFENPEYEMTEDCIFQNVTFRVDEDSYKILEQHDITNKLTPGKTFTCISAPIYLSNSYDCPLVSLEIDGEILLDFETGYKNLMATYGVKIND